IGSRSLFYEAASAVLGPLPLQQPPKSKPITPCAVVNGPVGPHTGPACCSRYVPGYWFNTAGANMIPSVRAAPDEKKPSRARTRAINAAREGGRQGRAGLERQGLPRDEVLSRTAIRDPPSRTSH